MDPWTKTARHSCPQIQSRGESEEQRPGLRTFIFIEEPGPRTMKTLTSLTLLLTSLTVVIDGNSTSKKSSGPVEPVRRRGGLSPPVRMVQRGRKRTVWSYNPGHRSLAFLVAGEVDTVTPPPVNPGTGDYRCLGCCGNKGTNPGEATAAPKISNRVNRILYPPEGIAGLGTEPNSINDRCLGCCEESVTPSLRVTPSTRGRSTQRQVQRGAPTGPQRGAPTGPQRGAPTGPQRGAPTGPQRGAPTGPQRGAPTGPQRGATVGRQGPRQTQQGGAYKPVPPPCTPPKCNPDWGYESSSSSEEMPVVRGHRARSRLQTAQLRSDTRCRHLGCRSALGLEAAPDDSDSSSSEED